MDTTHRPLSLIMNTASIERLMPSSRVPTGRRTRPQTNKGSRRDITETNHVLCAIYEISSLQPIVGICFLDLWSSSVIATQIVDTRTYVRTLHKLSVHVGHTMEIIVPNSLVMPKTSTLIKLIQGNFTENVSVVAISAKNFAMKPDLSSLEMYFDEVWKKSVCPEIAKRGALCSSIFALMWYVRESSNFKFVHHKLNFRYEAPDGTMFMDTNTIKSLELVESQDITCKGMTLLSSIDFTSTSMGKRLLKTNVLQPLTDKNSIMSRHEAIQELLESESLVDAIKMELKNYSDLDKLFSTLTRKPKAELDTEISDKKINNVLLLKEAVNVSASLSTLLGSLKSKLITEISLILNHQHLSDALNLIAEYINEDCVWASKSLELRAQQCNALKSNTNGLLDVNRQLYRELVDEILNNITNLSEKHDLPLESKYNNKRGFYIQLKDPPKELPNVFINRISRKSMLECTTLDLIKLNMRVDSALNEVLIISDQTIDDLISKLRTFSSTFFVLSEAISMLDLLCSLATVVNSSKFRYVSTEISSSILIKHSRHPLLEAIVTHAFVPNDIISMSSTSRVQILTGVNMSGKSVYLRQICFTQILSQIGCFVPADFANVNIYKSLFARISPDESQENMSTFNAEMSDVALILEMGDVETLVIIDELCRATSYNDSLSLSIAIVEKLIELKCTVFMTTHCSDLARILKDRPCVLEVFMNAETTEKGLRMTYKLTSGVNHIKGYGIKLLESTGGFPSNLLQKAREISEALQIAKYASVQGNSNSKVLAKMKLILDFYNAIKHVLSITAEGDLINQLKIIEFSFLEKLSSLQDFEENHIQEVHDADSNESLVLSVGNISVTTASTFEKEQVDDNNGNVKISDIKLDEVDEFLNFEFASNHSLSYDS